MPELRFAITQQQKSFLRFLGLALGIWDIAYPGLLTSAFVTCSTNVGEGLIKLSHVQ